MVKIHLKLDISLKFTEHMEDCSVSDEISEICWFCKKGRHEECMKEMPVNAKSEGPHECTFDTKLISCKCSHGK
jgi:hypothetical protein